MENLLLVFDEIDDAVAALRMLWPQVLGFVTACCLFGLTIAGVMRWPLMVVVMIAVACLAALLQVVRNKPLLRFRTDP